MNHFHLWVANTIAELDGNATTMPAKEESPLILNPVKAYVCGVYFLILSGEVVYVGKSKNVYARISQHMKRSMFEFDSFAFLESNDAEVGELEARYIHELNPRFNIEFPSHGEVKKYRKHIR